MWWVPLRCTLAALQPAGQPAGGVRSIGRSQHVYPRSRDWAADVALRQLRLTVWHVVGRRSRNVAGWRILLDLGIVQRVAMTHALSAGDLDRDQLVRRFTRDVYQGIETLTRLGYAPTQFKIMVDREGAVRAATMLILDRVPSYGLWRLKELGRLDMSVEMWALLPWYATLFEQSVRDHAERKLRLLDVDVDRELRQLIAREEPAGEQS